MKSLTDFLKFLPGIKPMVARRAILEGNAITPEARKDIHWRSDNIMDTVQVVGPDAAAAILTAYQNGKLPLQRLSMRPVDAPDTVAYLARSAEMREEIAERVRRERLVTDTSLVLEKDLADHHLLDRVFFEKNGPGPGTLVLAGITVTKSLSGYDMNRHGVSMPIGAVNH